MVDFGGWVEGSYGIGCVRIIVTVRSQQYIRVDRKGTSCGKFSRMNPEGSREVGMGCVYFL